MSKLFFDYNFRTAFDGSIIMDQELSAQSLGVQDGDTFMVRIVDGQVILQKQQADHGHSRTDQ